MQLTPIKKIFARPLKPASHNNLLQDQQGRSTETLEENKRPVVLRGSVARRRISIPVWDQCTTCNPHWHIRQVWTPMKRVRRVTPDLIQHI